MKILNYGIDEYIEKAREFHGHLAPGMICGGFMVDIAFAYLPKNAFYDAICETRACIPDSIQILTPCTIGNGWLKIMDTGRFALIFYDKYTGDGVRVALDLTRLEPWPEFMTWAMKLKPKKEQDKDRLFKEIISAGSSVYSVRKVRVNLEELHSGMKKRINICSSCGESFRSGDEGPSECPGCSGLLPFSYIKMESGSGAIQIKDALGKSLDHDMTRISPGISKEVAFSKDHVISENDIDTLEAMGKLRVYVDQDTDPDLVHENEAAILMARAMSGKNCVFAPEPKEGRIDIKAGCDGVLVVDRKKLSAFNMKEDVMCASLKGFSTVEKGRVVAGTRAIPLYISRNALDSALAELPKAGIFDIKEFRKKKAGIIVTGSEVASGKIKDRFAPMISKVLAKYGCEIDGTIICHDDRAEIAKAAGNMIKNGCDLIIATGGLSVDPDDVTRFALEDSGMTDIIYGSPILPGAMTLIGKIGKTDVLGVPAGALYSKPAAFDILLPLIVADIRITKSILSEMAEGGLLATCKRTDEDFIR